MIFTAKEAQAAAKEARTKLEDQAKTAASAIMDRTVLPQIRQRAGEGRDSLSISEPVTLQKYLWEHEAFQSEVMHRLSALGFSSRWDNLPTGYRLFINW